MPLDQLAPHLPTQLSRIVDVLLAKRPEDRYQSARALAADLDALRDQIAPAAAPTIEAGPSTIVVLPFDVIGAAEPRAQALSDGLAVDLASRLSRVPGVTVAPRTSVRAMSGQPIREIGQRLGARLVVEGSIQAEDGRVRVTATLIEAARERAALPSLVVERPLETPLAAQDEIAGAICDDIVAGLSRAPRVRDSQDSEAFHAFKRGQHQWRSCFGGGWRHAIEHFQHAIDRDPQFALAHVALGQRLQLPGLLRAGEAGAGLCRRRPRGRARAGASIRRSARRTPRSRSRSSAATGTGTAPKRRSGGGSRSTSRARWRTSITRGC